MPLPHYQAHILYLLQYKHNGLDFDVAVANCLPMPVCARLRKHSMERALVANCPQIDKRRQHFAFIRVCQKTGFGFMQS